MYRPLLFPLLVVLILQASETVGQPDDKQPPEGKDDVLPLIRLSLKDVPELKDVDLTGVTLRGDNILELSGKVPNPAVKTILKKQAEVVMKNLFDDMKVKKLYKVDVGGMIDQSVPPERRLAEFLNARLVGPGRPIQGKISEAAVGGDGTVRIKGAVLTEEMKGILAREGKKLLDEEVRNKNLPGPYNRLDTSGLRRYPNDIYGLLEASLPDVPGLEGFRLIYAELTPNGIVKMAGLIAAEEQRPLLRRSTVTVITNAIESGKLPADTKLENVDVTRVRVGSSSVDELLVVESLMPSRPTRVIRAAYYDPVGGEIHLTGVVESEAGKKRVVEDLEKLPLLQRVIATGVLVRQGTSLRPGEGSGTLLSAQDALGRCNNGEEVVRAATASIRNASAGSASALNAWYLRAAGHMLLGKKREALGDMRVAQALAENFVGADNYYATLERFQGCLRIQLSDLMQNGAQSIVVAQQQTPKTILEVLQESLRDVPALMGLRLESAELTRSGVLMLTGQVSTAEQQRVLQLNALEVMRNAVESGAVDVARRIDSVDVTGIRVAPR